MKKILITGKNSYIGTSVEKYLTQWPEEYSIDTLDVHGDSWKKHDFSQYDVLYHVAGIAHADVGNVSEETKKLYYQVNCDLTYEVAKKAKIDGVKQFIFMSSIIVYGESAPVGEKKIITKSSEPHPENFYGDSKLQADIKLKTLRDMDFNICILRPPMIYGPESKGNYRMLSKMAQKLPFFPTLRNERSMLYIGNLCFFVRKCIDQQASGIYFPQNKEYVSTSNMVKEIAKQRNRKIYLIGVFNPGIRFLTKLDGKLGKLANKAFGNLVYEKVDLIDEYSFEDSVRHTEEKV